jgi:DNA-binding response OmpR family regulator
MAKRIFVVDDEKCIADTLVRILCNSGYEAIAFYNTQSALEQLESFSPELVVSDVVMPGMSGVEMAVLIRDRHPTCKVLLFSGQASTADLLEGVRRQGYDFELLAKPVHPSEFLARAANIGNNPDANLKSTLALYQRGAD